MGFISIYHNVWNLSWKLLLLLSPPKQKRLFFPHEYNFFIVNVLTHIILKDMCLFSVGTKKW